MIKVKSGTVSLTEQTVKEIMRAIEEAKKVTEFTDEPMPEGDMDTGSYIRLKRERGTILVKSPFMEIEYSISLETKPQTQESAGYKLELGKGAVQIGKDGRCQCSCADECPLGRRGMGYRCTEEELKSAGIQIIK